MSFGIICYRTKSESEPELEYLLIQRKDSLSFMEFIRGKYNISDTAYVKRLVGAMTNKERSYLLTWTFEQLWNHVWYQAFIPKQTTEFLEARKKFDRLRKGFLDKNTGAWVNLSEILRMAPSPYTEPEWGFPKGRRRLREDDVDCALREFCEETGIEPKDVKLKDFPPYEEIFFGTNNVLYRHVYYVGQYNGKKCEFTIDPLNLNQAREIGAVGWFSYKDTLARIRDHNQERKQLFSHVHHKLAPPAT